MNRLRFRLLNDDTLRFARIAIVTGLGYYVGGLVGLQLRLPASTPSVLWPPNPILTAVLLLTAPRQWGAVLLGALVAHFAVELPTEWPTLFVTLIFITNCGEALLAAGGIRWLSDSPTAFDTSRRLGNLSPVGGDCGAARLDLRGRGRGLADEGRVVCPGLA